MYLHEPSGIAALAGVPTAHRSQIKHGCLQSVTPLNRGIQGLPSILGLMEALLISSTVVPRRTSSVRRSAFAALSCSALLCACGGNAPETGNEPTIAATQASTPTAAPLPSSSVLDPAAVAVTPSAAWRVCATEYETCRLNGTQQVRYGLRGKYVYGTFRSSVSCTNGVFGDPLPGELKRCEVSLQTEGASTPAPSLSLAPAATSAAEATPTPSTGAVQVAAPATPQAPAPAPATTITTGTTQDATPTPLSIASLRANMVGAHESTIVGVPPEWSWGTRPIWVMA